MRSILVCVIVLLCLSQMAQADNPASKPALYEFKIKESLGKDYLYSITYRTSEDKVEYLKNVSFFKIQYLPDIVNMDKNGEVESTKNIVYVTFESGDRYHTIPIKNILEIVEQK